MSVERGIMRFEGGPHHGQKLETWLPPTNVRYVYRSPIIGDDTIYRCEYKNFSRYFKFYNIWKYEQDVVLSHLLDTQQIDAFSNIPAVHR
jgi:hypothetical protein